ncbi:MAG TPA: hypothetical protein VN133_07955 [Humibacter sp.]|nr:hypothetical protein [Humibacter sp.]
MTSDDQHADALREWARGSTTLAAATELLIRAGFAEEGRPWIHYDELARRPWINFDEIPDLIGGKSGGEQRLLRIAASIGGTTPIVLGDEVVGLDRHLAELVLIAMTHAAGYTEATSDLVWEGEEPRRIMVPPLAQWPDVTA